MTQASKTFLQRLKHPEAATWALALLTAISGHGAASSLWELLQHLSDSNEQPHSPPWVATLAWTSVFILLTLLIYCLHANPIGSKLPRKTLRAVRRQGVLLWLSAAAAAITLYGLSTWLHALLGGHPPHWGLLAVYVLAFVILGYFILHFHDPLLIVHTAVERTMTAAMRRRNLILPLSEVTDCPQENDFRPSIQWSDPPNLDQDLKTLKEAKKLTPSIRWKWEMPLRAIYANVDVLEHVILLCSPQSIVQATAFSRIVGNYELGTDVRVWAFDDASLALIDPEGRELNARQGVDFNDMNALSGYTVDLVRALAIDGVSADEIMIDMTGGKKPVSFVVAAVTMRGPILALYIDTETCEALVYDIGPNAEARAIG